MTHRLDAYYNSSGAPIRDDLKLDVRYDEWVIWGYGERKPGCFETVSPAKTSFFGRLSEFELPEGSLYRGTPQEYTRVSSWAWRFTDCDRAWSLADTPEKAVAAAQAEAVVRMRNDGWHECHAYLATKHSVVLTDIRKPNTKRLPDLDF